MKTVSATNYERIRNGNKFFKDTKLTLSCSRIDSARNVNDRERGGQTDVETGKQIDRKGQTQTSRSKTKKERESL